MFYKTNNLLIENDSSGFPSENAAHRLLLSFIAIMTLSTNINQIRLINS